MKTTIGKYASYIYVKPWDDSFKPIKTKELADGIILDYNKDGELVGIEILAELIPEYSSDLQKSLDNFLNETGWDDEEK